MPRPTSRRKKRKLSATSEEGARAVVAVVDPVPVVVDAAKAEVAVKNPEGNRPGERSSPEKVHAAGADRAEGKDAGAVEVVAVALAALVAEEIAARVAATPEQAPSA